jgi:predicted dehydrogenase
LGANLVRVFQRLGVLDRICESNPRRIAEVAAIYRDIRVERSYEALLGDSSIDGVVIATPAETHYALAKEALRAGKDVFVEKPMTLQSTETEELTAMAEGFGRILMVGHLLEFHPAILRLQQLIEEGYLGRIEYIYSNRLNLGKVRREENALWSFAPHDISVILFLLNELPMQVTATGGTLITDNAGIDLNPATGTIQFTYAGIAQFNITGMNTASLSPTAVMSATLNGVLTSAVSFTVAISDHGFHIPSRRMSGGHLATPTVEMALRVRSRLRAFLAPTTSTLIQAARAQE